MANGNNNIGIIVGGSGNANRFKGVRSLNILSKGLEQVGLERADVWRVGVSHPAKQETANIASS